MYIWFHTLEKCSVPLVGFLSLLSRWNMVSSTKSILLAQQIIYHYSEIESIYSNIEDGAMNVQKSLFLK